ncbi:MAG: 6-phosphogluconolactonase [Limisphaera sp.]|nr:MAG: 6-phosphogluconolactonase [Limisphaera sp.]
MKSPYDLTTFPDAATLAAAVAGELTARLRHLCTVGSRVAVALSGGRIALPLFDALRSNLDKESGWRDTVHWFWADERLLPHDDPQSNYRLARLHLLDPLNVPADRRHPVPCARDPLTAARQADEELRQSLGTGEQNVPVLDLVLLGMGEDGHIASLFPGVPVEVPRPHAAYAGVRRAPKPPPDRVTLTWEALAAAQTVWVLVSGSGKGAALQRALKGDDEVPLGRLLQLRSGTRLFVEKAALPS